MKISPTNAVAKALGGTNELRDIRPPFALPTGWEWAWWVAGLLAALALAYWIWRFAKRPRRVAAVPDIPPHERAMRKLHDALAWIHDPRAFCIAVSDALRWYLEERFEFRAPERTTEEFLVELQRTPLLSPGQKETLADFLQRCDLVKFAKHQPGELELRDLHASAVRLVQETAPASPEPAARPVET
jgi:hypothetical protein